MGEIANKTQTPPYAAWSTFRNFISGLREHGLPTQINRSVMSNLSFSAQAQLTAALKSLGLIDAKGTPTAILSELVAADESAQPKVLDKIIRSHYAMIFKELDLSRATPGELESHFKAAGLSGSTVGRAIAFFLNAAASAGIGLSAHIKKNGAQSSSLGRSSRTVRRRRPASAADRNPPPPPPPPPRPTDEHTAKSFEEGLLSKFPGFDPSWPDELKKSWFEGFKTLMGMAPAKKQET